jgi:Na+/H+ antiporter NhaD/arsenite permease-like protein
MPLSIILLLVTLPILLKIYGKNFSVSDEYQVETLCQINPRTMINSRQDFIESVVAFAILIIGFAIGPTFGLPPPMIALLVAGFLLILSHERVTEFLSEVGWETVFFLVGLFGLVVALELTGLIEELGVAIEAFIAGNDTIATVFMVWIPAMLSAFLDNLPVSAVLAPIAVRPEFASLGPILPLALVFAVNIGGYIFTPLGSPANMIAIAYSEREHDHISFSEFAKIGTILGIIHLTLGSIWLLLLGLII